MEYIYQKSLYQFFKKEEINKIFINKDKENIEIEIDDDILNFFLQNFKKNYKILKNKIFEYRDQEEKKKFEEFDKKLKEKNLKISKDKLENLLKEKYRVIREKVAPFITSDNLNFLISNGCSMYTGSKGINDTAKNDLLNIIERYKSKKGLQYLLKTIDFTNLSPEKVLDKLYQIDNFHTNILSKKVVSEKIKSLIKEYKEIFLKNYVLEINYKNPYLHEELLLKLVSIKKQNHINIFTLNYDILIEVSAEKLGIPINNGFQGFQIRKFNPANFNYKNYVETSNGDKKIEKSINLIKLHGSLSWEKDESALPYNIIEKQLELNKTDNENWKLNYSNKEKIIIYPVQTKKAYTLDLPYSEMFRQFNDVINKTNSTLFIMGYSFSDEHINDIIENSLSNPFINIVLFLYSNQEECLKNEYLKKLITRACIDSRLTIFFGDTLSDFENIVSDILPIEAEKNPYREVIRQLEELVRIKNGDEE